MDNNTAKVVEFPGVAAGFGHLTMTMGRILAIDDDDLVVALGPEERVVRCDILASAGGFSISLAADDAVLVAVPHESRIGARGVVLGRIGPYGQSQPASRVVVCATESLELKCGDASIDLRADGKVMVRGEDVLLRAKGTQRIRAGTVSIN